MGEEKHDIAKYTFAIEDHQNEAINQLTFDLSEARSKIESLSKDLETYKNAFRRISEESEDLKKKISSIKTIVNLL